MDAGDGQDGVITRLFTEVREKKKWSYKQYINVATQGNYTHILRQIFLYLDGTSLRCAELVCWSWRRFVLEEVWENADCSKLLEKGWTKGIPATR